MRGVACIPVMSKGLMSGIQRETEAVMELRKEKKKYRLHLVGAMRDGRTFAQFQFILSNGCIFEFGDYLQSGLPDLRDELIKR